MKITKSELREMIREALREELAVRNNKKPITESYSTNWLEIPGFDFYIAEEFEDEGIKGYNVVYIKNDVEIVEVEVWEEDSPVTVNKNLYTQNLMSRVYDSFDSFAADLEYKCSRYLK